MNQSLTVRSAFGLVFLSVLTAFVLGGLVMGIALSTPNSDQSLLTYISFFIGQGSMVLPLFYYLKTRKQSFVYSLRLNPVSPHIIIHSIVLAIGFSIISDELGRIINIIVPTPDYIIDIDNILMPDNLFGFIMMVIVLTIIAPIGEELLFRGFLQKFLEDHWKDVTRAVLVTSLFFALIHLNPFWAIQIYILGVVLGYVAWRTQSIYPSLVFHGVINGMALLIGVGPETELAFYIWNEHVALWVLVPALFFVYLGLKGIKRSTS